jgi:hypothetical protein
MIHRNLNVTHLLRSLILCLVLVPAVQAQGTLQVERVSEARLLIEDTGGRIEGAVIANHRRAFEFSADYSISGEVVLNFTSKSQSTQVSVDLQIKTATFRGTDLRTGQQLVMQGTTKREFRQLLHLLQLNRDRLMELQDPVNARALDLLGKTTELMAMFDQGRMIEVTISAPVQKGWTSLCSAIGQSRTAYWTNATQSRSMSFTVGGHGVCKGRCGAGCPWFADPAYTQDCLNHDACAGEEGEQYGVCSGEWNSAADDFLFAPDCT